MSPGDSQTITLPDGRQLGYAIYGSRHPRAAVFVAFHGTPGSRLDYRMLHEWALKNGVTLVCPERPGYGLSTIDKNYVVTKHAHDVQRLMDHVGYERYKVIGAVGGGPYALAFTHICTKVQVQGTLLIAPVAPIDAPKTGLPVSGTGRPMNRYLWRLLTIFPFLMELRVSIVSRKFLKNLAALNPPTEELRKTEQGRKIIEGYARHGTPAGYVHDYCASHRYWGFELRDTDANRIVIFAGGMDVQNPPDGMRYMRDRQRNTELFVHPHDNHMTLQRNQMCRALQILRNM